MNEIIIDAEGLILGRMASFAAKQALLGRKVIVLNSEKSIISGNRKEIFQRFKKKVIRGIPAKGPFYPKRADRIARRVIRGMLPFKKPRGKEVYSNILCYIGVPEEFKKAASFKLPSKTPQKYISLDEVCRLL